MPRLEDSLQITIKDEPLPQVPSPSPLLTANAGGSDMPDGAPLSPIEAGRTACVEKFMDDSIPLEDSLPMDEPEFVMKPAPRDQDLFEEPEPEPEATHVAINPLAQEIYPMDAEFKKRTPTGKLQKPKGINSNGKKRKPMTPEHKAKLAFAREKALAKRRANSKQRKDEKVKLNPPKQEVSQPEPEPVKAPTHAPPKQRDNITREDLEEISLKTVIALETMRKKRKDEKKKKKAEEQYKSEVMDTIRKASPSWIETSGIYSDCF